MVEEVVRWLIRGGSCKEEFGSTCKGLPADNEYEGARYCVLHFPRVDKDLDEFKEAIEKKLKDKDFDFRGVYFPGNQSLASFLPNDTFEGEADFSDATFKGSAYFSHGVTFGEGAFFLSATFKGEAFFSRATFKGEASFRKVAFESEADFSDAIFKEVGKFWPLYRPSSQTFLSFRSAVIEKPERLSFHNALLRPSWFIDVDAQKFDFSDVEWFRLPNGKKLPLEKEIEFLDELPRTSSGYEQQNPRSNLRELQRACRKLMNNAEENRDYATANEFHYWSMELLRKEAMALVLASEKGLREAFLREALRRFGLIDALYWLLSGYGERPRRAFLVLVGMGTLFAILYVIVAGSIEHVGEAFLYSLAAMVRLTGVPAMAPLTKLLQPSEPGLFQILVTAEGILGPLQIALLALAVRRQVMR